MDKPETVRMNMKQKKEMKVGRKERKLRMREGTERIKYKKEGFGVLGRWDYESKDCLFSGCS